MLKPAEREQIERKIQELLGEDRKKLWADVYACKPRNAEEKLLLFAVLRIWREPGFEYLREDLREMHRCLVGGAISKALGEGIGDAPSKIAVILERMIEAQNHRPSKKNTSASQSRNPTA